MSHNSQVQSYFSKVSVIGGSIVRYSFHIKAYMEQNQTNYFALADAIFQKTGLRFKADNVTTAINISPYFGLYALSRNYKQSYNWTIEDKTERDRLVASLKMLEPILAGLGMINPIYVNTKDIWSSIVKSKNSNPILITGEKVYELTLREDLTGRPQRPTEAFQQEVLDQVENIKTQYELSLQEEIKAVQEAIQAYAVPFEDFVLGFSSFVYDDYGTKNKCLSKKIIYYPTHVMLNSNDTRQLRKEEQEKMRQEILIVYMAKQGSIQTWNSDLSSKYDKSAATPHTFSGGAMCTGSYYPPTNATYEEAKSILNKIEEQLKMINMRSLAGGGRILYNGNLVSVSELDFKKMCDQTELTEVRDGVIF